MKFWRFLCLVALLGILAAWMGMIYRFSAQDGASSSLISHRVAQWLIRVLSLDVPSARFNSFHGFVRKAAHFLAYAGLGAWGYLFMRVLGVRMPALCSLLISAGFAVLDEFHQLSVSGRSGLWTDVCIDTAGAFCGAMCMAFATLLFLLLFGGRRTAKRNA